MIRFIPFLRGVRRDRRGTAITEFALTAPVFLLLLMGIFDFCWQMYTQQVLQGAVADAARLSTLEGNAAATNQTALDDIVRNKVKAVMGGADVQFTRKAYENFSGVGQQEVLEDKNANGKADKGECFDDMNGNNSWDNLDQGRNGNGGASDVVLYTATVKLNRILPVWKMLGQSEEVTLSSSTVLRNQPYRTTTSTRKKVCVP